MPIFSYQCKKCAKKFDVLVRDRHKEYPVRCPECQGSDVKKIFAPFSVSGPGGKSCSTCSGGSCTSCS